MILISTFKFFAILSTKEKHPESSSSQNARNIKSLIHTLYVCDGLNGEYNSKKEVHFFRKSVKLVHLVYVFVFDLNISANHPSHQFSKGSIGIHEKSGVFRPFVNVKGVNVLGSGIPCGLAHRTSRIERNSRGGCGHTQTSCACFGKLWQCQWT